MTGPPVALYPYFHHKLTVSDGTVLVGMSCYLSGVISETVVSVICAKCANCPAWIILHHSVTKHPEQHINEVKCPVDSCETIVRVQNHESKMWQIPESWIKKGYFYEGELKEL